MEPALLARSLILAASIAAALTSPVWNSDPLHACPNIPAEKDLSLEQVTGDWRLAYLFLAQVDEGLDEDHTCVVISLTPGNSSNMDLSVFIDSLRSDHIDRSMVQFPADIVSNGEWKVHTPLTSAGYLHARVIRASDEHLVVTFCAPQQERAIDNEIEGSRRRDGSPEEGLDWRSLFETRRKRSYDSYLDKAEMHMWTAVLVKHNNVSALKFVEYAAVLMKHGYDVTQGELVSFGKCPVSRPHHKTIDPL